MHPQTLIRLGDQVVRKGRDVLDLSMGIVSHIYESNYEIVAVSSAGNVFVPGEAFPLEDTFCRDVYSSKQTITLTHHDEKCSANKHPLYKQLPLEAYISAPILYKEQVWGTLNFSCFGQRKSAFTAEEVNLVEGLALELSQALK